MIRLTVGTPGVGDGTSYYRAAGPLGRLRQQMAELAIDYPPAFGWPDFKAADIVMFQRPGSEDHLKIIRLAKNCDLPVWVDMDDDLLDVPPHNPGWEVFLTRGEIVKECLSLADVVTTATEELAIKLRQYAPRVVVIPNALDESLLKNYDPIEKHRKANKKAIYWRGANGHVKDLYSVQNQIKRAAEEFPETQWYFHGYWPWHVFDAIDSIPDHKKIQVSHIKAMEVIDYFQFLKKEISFAHCMIPLENTQWNKNKSNISWIEATLAGCQSLVPAYFPEFDKPGVIKYYSPDDFHLKLRDMIQGDCDPKNVQRSLEYIQDNLTLTKVNQLRIDLIYSLLQK